MIRYLLISCALVLLGCQSFRTVELAVPTGKDLQVKELVQAVSGDSSLVSCAKWHIRVVGADECFGGKVGGNSITVYTEPITGFYTIKISVRSAGFYDNDSYETLVNLYRTKLETLFLKSEIIERKSSQLPKFERI